MTWCLVGNTGAVHVLPQSMIFVGRDNCEINILSRSVDKRHSVINFDRRDNAFFIKDMETLNGTFVNDTRIPDQTYISLQRGDSIRFGYDPVTYRFDEVDPSSIRQFKAEDEISKLGYPSRPNRQHDAHSSRQYEARTTPVENKMTSHGRTTPLKQDYSVVSQPSPLYGQPAWWGQEDADMQEGQAKEKGEGGRKSRSGMYSPNDKDANGSSSHPNPKQLERPTRLPLNEAERDRDIPVQMYTRSATDLNPTTPVKRPPTPEHTEVTLVSASEKHVGFTIEFNAKDDAPKLSMTESLSEFVPAGVKSKMEGSSKMVEDMKAERMKKSLAEDQDSYQSPRISPSAVQKLNMWASAPGKKGAKVSQGDSRSANNSEASKVDSAKHFKMRPNARQPVPSKSGPVKSQSSLGHHKDDEQNDQNGDNVSESGTYTIESESQSKEALEARSKIDEVFGVGVSMDTKQGSDEDTDKDIGDEEIQEEVVTMETVHTQETDISRYMDQAYSKPREQDMVKPMEKHAPFQPKPPATGSSTAPAWVRQWAVLATKDNNSLEHSRSPCSDSSQSPRDQSQGGASGETRNRSPRQGPTAPPRRASKRLLPTTPRERGDSHLPYTTGSKDVPRQNGLNIRQSPSSAFYSPHNQDGGASGEREVPAVNESNISPREKSKDSNPEVFVSEVGAGVGSSLALHTGEDEDFHTEVSVDTEILLKDTETFVKSLEMRMRDRQRSTPSPDLSESYDLSHRSFDGDIDTDLDSCVSLVGSSGNAYPLRSNKASLPPSGYQGNRSVRDRSSEPKSDASKTTDAKSKKASIWNRLSQPVRYKCTEKTQTAQSKDSSVTSDCMSDSMDSASFRRNTNVTGSLPTGRITSRKTHRDAESKDTSPKIIRKIKANLSKPRQTRSTMLRKSRFDGKDSPSLDQNDLSPSSSISDMSSSRNSSMFRRPGTQRELGARCQSPKDLHSRTKTASARIDTGRQRVSSRNSEQSPRSEVSLGGQIVQQARSQSLRERKMNAGEASARIMGKVQTTSSRTVTSTSTRKTSQSSADPSAVKKASTGAWRRYKEPPSETDSVDAYIRSVTSRQSSLSSADESSIKSAPAYNYCKPRSNSNPTPYQYKTARSMQHLTGGAHHHHQQQQQFRQEALRNGGGEDDIAQASNSLAESLQRLAKGESTLGMAVEHIPKDELLFHFVRMMDEILAEDTVGVGASEVQPRETENRKQPLQRSISVGFNSEGLFTQSPTSAQPGSPPISLKHKQWSKPESFDMLVMSSINHLSVKLKDSADKIAYKLKKLQSPNATDAELREVLKDTESPLLKTHNKEIASILKNMRQLEKRLSEIHTMIDPREEIDVPEQLTPAAQIRRKYISDYGGSTSNTEAASVTIQGGQPKTQHRSKGSPGSSSTPGETPRSARSDESEYYI